MIHSHGQQTGIVRQTAITQPLPLLYDKAASVSMLNHAMDVVLYATQFLHAGQIPVLACDNPCKIHPVGIAGVSWYRYISSHARRTKYRNGTLEYSW